MRLLCLLFPFLLWLDDGSAQVTRCSQFADSNKVIRIAKEWDIYWTGDWICPPHLKLDTLSCTWTLTTCKRSYTNKGGCKHTRGCTIWTIATLVVDEYGKIVSLKKQEELSHNYE